VIAMTSARNPTREHIDEAVPAPADASTAAAGAPAGPSVAELEDRWRRAVAELDNVRKRFERQLADQARAERARIVGAFLPVLDNLELALQHAGADPAAIVAGVQAVRSQALDVLAGLGYGRIDPVGERFDPSRHEAARVVPAAEGREPGTIVDVRRPGYIDAAGTLVRPAVVTVAQDDPTQPEKQRAAQQEE
jgi:molecular chaperone GrpE